MSFSFADFKASEHKSGGTTVPDGHYVAMITKASFKETASGGEGLSLELVISEGEQINCKLLAFINVKNASAKAQEIGLGQLGDLCRGLGVEAPDSTAWLVGKKIGIRTKAKEDALFGMQSQVTGYMSVEKSRELHAKQQPATDWGVASPVTSQPVAAPQQVASAAPPWATTGDTDSPF